MRAVVLAGLLTAGMFGLLPGTALAQEYVPIPPGFDFPADQATLERFRDTENTSEMRRHAWYVFAGLTQPAPGAAAVWETWYPQQLVFSKGAPEAEGGGALLRPFEVLRQNLGAGASPEASEDQPLSFVMFNQEARAFIRSKMYNDKAVLDALLTKLTPGAPEARQVEEFDRNAIGLKLVFRVISATEPSVQPVWDGIHANALAQRNPPSSWKRVVIVDPTRPSIPPGETKTVSWHGASQEAAVVGLDRFFHFPVTAAQLDAIKQIVGENVAVGDHVILVGMHFTTKEIPNWVWATFWWHDKPSEGQFGADRPSAVTGVWRNFRMDVAYSADTPLEYDSTPNAAFNPFIESFGFGTATNCMGCHQQARWPKGGFFPGDQGFDPSMRGALLPSDPFFDGTLRTDFLWAIPFLAN